MIKDLGRAQNCYWCGGAISYGSGPQLRPFWKRYQCKKCKSICYGEVRNSKELSEIYQSAWGASNSEGKFAAGSTDEHISKSLLRAFDFDGVGVCLDYGAGKGALSRLIAERTGQCFAVEPFGDDLNSIKGVRHYKKIDEISDDIKFDWIFLIEVIEHMIDPVTEVSKIANRLSDKGKLIVTTPNACGWRAQKEKFLWREAQNPTHINLFSENALRACLEKSGLQTTKRLYAPVDFGRGGFLARVFILLTQLIGVDGGLRVVASK